MRSANVPATNATPERDREHREAEPHEVRPHPAQRDADHQGVPTRIAVSAASTVSAVGSRSSPTSRPSARNSTRWA